MTRACWAAAATHWRQSSSVSSQGHPVSTSESGTLEPTNPMNSSVVWIQLWFHIKRSVVSWCQCVRIHNWNDFAGNHSWVSEFVRARPAAAPLACQCQPESQCLTGRLMGPNHAPRALRVRVRVIARLGGEPVCPAASVSSWRQDQRAVTVHCRDRCYVSFSTKLIITAGESCNQTLRAPRIQV